MKKSISQALRELWSEEDIQQLSDRLKIAAKDKTTTTTQLLQILKALTANDAKPKEVEDTEVVKKPINLPALNMKFKEPDE
jgi:hypothetical protein